MGSLRSFLLPRASAIACAAVLAVLVAPVALGHALLPAASPTLAPSTGAGVGIGSPAPGSALGMVGPVHPALAAPFSDPANLLPALPWESLNAVGISSGTPWVPLMLDGERVDAGAPVQGGLTFWCPSVGGAPTVNDSTNTMTLQASCPYRIIDDADLMGSPQIAVNQNDPNSLAFFSLHGAGTTQGPTTRSRDPSPEGTGTLTGLSHTTFTSADMGRSWYDNPWGTDGFGEHASGVMDNDGNLYIAALWSKRLGDGAFDYVIKVYKEQDGRFQISNYQPSKTFSNRAAGNTIEEANLVYLPAPDWDALNGTGNETGNGTGNVTGPAGSGSLGNYTNGDSFGVRNSPDDRIMVVWHEQARDWRNATTGKSSWIDAAWTDTTAHDNWTRLNNTQLIGPCIHASNPVAFMGKAYVACVADAGYSARSRARVGDVDIWSIDPMTGETELIEFSKVQGGIDGGRPRLVARPDGFMALTHSEVLADKAVMVQMNFGWYGKHWETPREVGFILHDLASNTIARSLPDGVPQPPPASNSVVDARISAMALTGPTDALVLVYMERVDPAAAPSDPTNPSALGASSDQAIEYKKIVATFTKCDGPHAVYDLQVGVVRHPFADAILGNSTGVFDDLQDGMQVWQDPATLQERIYFAYGDHGVIQYGALIADQNIAPIGCFNPQPLLQVPPPPIPAAQAAVSPATTMVGAMVGTTALAMVGYLLTVKRKSAVALATKAKK